MKKYKVIYADPPWRFKNFSEKGEGRNAISHYDCLTLPQLKKLDILRYAANDCALFLWVTDPMLDQGLEVIKSWGFQFKTVAFYWVKTNQKVNYEKLSVEKDFFTGLGYWTRANCEQCLLATKGNPRRIGKNVRRLLISKRREHSRKPEEIYEMIESLIGGPYLELFARKTKSGWDSWGNKVELFNGDEKNFKKIDTRKRPSKWLYQDEQLKLIS
jgi:N6-adenosine-specific RNA methylase IME4